MDVYNLLHNFDYVKFYINDNHILQILFSLSKINLCLTKKY